MNISLYLVSASSSTRADMNNSWFNAFVNLLADGLELASGIEHVGVAVCLEERKERLGSLIVHLNLLG